MARTLSDIEKAKIREYIDSRKLHSTPREKLAAMILAELGIEISGVSAARIRKEAFEDQDTANSRKEACIREKVLEHVEAETPKILGYIQDEIQALRDRAFGRQDETSEEKQARLKMSISDRTRLSRGILDGCKTLIEIVGPPKPDRHITTTIEIMETSDVSEYMKYGDKGHGADPSEVDDPEGDQKAEADAGPGGALPERD
jgi:hypothetical protein